MAYPKPKINSPPPPARQGWEAARPCVSKEAKARKNFFFF
jgi:hypothetical protein